MTSKNEQKNIPQISWDKTPIFRKGKYALVTQLKTVCGENVFGKKINYANRARDSVFNFLEKAASMTMMKGVPNGHIITTPPTREECISKLSWLCDRASEYYTKYPQTDVTDLWAKRIRKLKDGEPLNISNQHHRRVWSSGTKRFSGKVQTLREQITDMVKGSRGMLAEGHVIAFLNSGLQCPECKAVGQIGWCDGISHRSVDAFRDAICMNCHANNVLTLFEIKTRWENAIDNQGTFAGSFAALNTLMTLQANIYLVIASRDTGDVRIGKITHATMRGNNNWLYALQENLDWGSPSSYVVCEGGMFKTPVKMPPIIETLTDEELETIYSEVLANANWEKIDNVTYE